MKSNIPFDVILFDGTSTIPAQAFERVVLVFTAPFTWTKVVSIARTQDEYLYPLIEHEVKKFYPGEHDDLRVVFQKVDTWMPKAGQDKVDAVPYMVTVWSRSKELKALGQIQGQIKVSAGFEYLLDAYKYLANKTKRVPPDAFGISTALGQQILINKDGFLDGPFPNSKNLEIQGDLFTQDSAKGIPWRCVQDLRIPGKSRLRTALDKLLVTAVMLCGLVILGLSCLIFDQRISDEETAVSNQITTLQSQLMEFQALQDQHLKLQDALGVARARVLPDVNGILLKLTQMLNPGDILLYVRWDAQTRQISLRIRAQDALSTGDKLANAPFLEELTLGTIQSQEGSLYQLFSIQAKVLP